MNDLQLALAGLGALLVVGVFAHGKWQEIRQRRIAAKMLAGGAGDPLLDGVAPVGPTASSPAPKAAPAPAERREPTLGELAADSPADAATPAGLPAGEPGLPLLSPDADYIAAFDLVEPAGGAELEALPRDAFDVLKRRIAWIGYNEARRAWEPVHPLAHYRRLRIGIQLADRSGPLTGGLIEQFAKAVEKVGDALTAVPELPNARDAVARAMRLDRLCAEVDIQLNVHIAPRHDAFAPDTVREAALGIGFRLESDGVLAYPDAGGQRQFALQMPSARTADGLPAPTACLLLEVPCVAHGEVAFDRMMAIAQELADALDGIVVDEHRRPVTDRFVLPVRQQIVELQARMAGQGVAPGSPLALRLFS